MSYITDIKEQVNDLIDEWGSDIVFTPISKTTTYGGYSGSETESTASAVETKGIPANLISRRFSLQRFGDSEGGVSRVVVKSEVSLTSGTEYKVTWNNDSWNLVDIQKRGHFQNDNAFQVVELAKHI